MLQLPPGHSSMRNVDGALPDPTGPMRQPPSLHLPMVHVRPGKQLMLQSEPHSSMRQKELSHSMLQPEPQEGMRQTASR